MKVPLSWLREMVAVDLPPAEIARLLMMSGTEVASLRRVGEEWRRVVVARVVELAPHPTGDNLLVAVVDVGDGRRTIVTGATNLRPGDLVPAVLPGGALGPGREIGSRSFRGVTSEGMLCSGLELGLSDDAEGIYVLEPTAPVGAELAAWLDEWVFDLELTPNRPDCLSVLGIAREVAALTGAELHPPRWELPRGEVPARELVSVEIADPDLCGRYVAAVLRDASIGPSPTWMQRRLFLCDVRAHNNIVDVTNYVMLELGQPLHAFDARRLHGGIIVRRARPGERLVTLDGDERELSPEMLVIADHERPVALAGVMGGLNSEVGDFTTDIVLESANFNMKSIRTTSRWLRLATDASRRFDKGLDPESALPAACRAIALMQQLAGGSVADGVVDVYPRPPERRTISFTLGQVSGLLGREYDPATVEETLRRLGFRTRSEGEWIRAEVPSWRRDVEGCADIAEEVARITGYDAIPSTPLDGAIPLVHEDPSRRWIERLKLALAGAGLQEVITYSLVAPGEAARLRVDGRGDGAGDLAPIALDNPMSSEQSVLRTTLLDSLLRTVAANLRHTDRVAIFELARVYLPPLRPLPEERRHLALALAGPRLPRAWNSAGDEFDFFDCKGLVELVVETLRLHGWEVRPVSSPTLHPGRAAALIVRGPGGEEAEAGHFGQIHPRVAKRYDIERRVYAAELDLERLLPLVGEEYEVRPLARFPGVALDLAVVVDEEVPHAAVERIIREAGGPLLVVCDLFDLYRGEPIPPGKKSLAYALQFRAPDRTLAEAEVAPLVDGIAAALTSRLGARIRGREGQR